MSTDNQHAALRIFMPVLGALLLSVVGNIVSTMVISQARVGVTIVVVAVFCTIAGTICAAWPFFKR